VVHFSTGLDREGEGEGEGEGEPALAAAPLVGYWST